MQGVFYGISLGVVLMKILLRRSRYSHGQSLVRIAFFP